MQTDSNTATLTEPATPPAASPMTLILVGDAVNSGTRVNGKPAKSYKIERNRAGFAMLHRTIEWAVNNDVKVSIVYDPSPLID